MHIAEKGQVPLVLLIHGFSESCVLVLRVYLWKGMT
ncbi:hypothetical protein BDE02_09G106400 [Populus trichocarpa]|nr:hypothetical protein BDE02_09G106400 [Populus trichocarpa]